MEKLFDLYQRLIPVTILVSFLGFMTAMAMNTPDNNPFLTEEGHLIAELEFQDGQMGFVGISGISWTILPNGNCQAARFINDTFSPPHQTGKLDQQDLVTLSNILFDQNFADLSSEIPSEPTLNPHSITIRLGEKLSTLELPNNQSIEYALIKLQNRHETLQSRFLTIAQVINRLVQQHCEDN
ncbi:MAG: hypothetical protein QNJ55_22840 [Xenococcus sp. MO_188.B8]|nr:hypothetical protein [Xenococcus sp. MO_188.B8]